MRGNWGRLAAGGLALCWAQGAMACGAGDVTVSFSPTTVAVASWSPFPNGSQMTAQTTVTVTRTGSSNIRSARLMILDSEATSPLRVGTLNGFPGPIYSLTGGNVFQSPTSSTPTAGNSLPFTYTSNSNSNVQNATTTLTIPINTAGDDFTPGTYSQTTTYFVQCYNNSGSFVGGGSTGAGPTLNVTVPNLLQVITAGPQTINFGSFTTTTQSLAISLKSTGAVNANVSTQNGNQMVLTGAPSPVPTNSTIPYSMTFDGQNVPAAGVSLANLARAGVGGGNKSLVLTLPALPSGKLAGTYKDIITLTLTPGS
ncbi:hypothetical protein [Sphingobium sp.]|uniref:hypothetical protein n=1 Tax=Sphingobium sp. TaxID=1912891 RepID=UPI0028BD9A95|nr:hypothetical protein [Sphingobium sp.]